MAKRSSKRGRKTAGRRKPPSAAARRETRRTPESDQTLLLNIRGLGLPTPARPVLVEFFPTPEQFHAEENIRRDELELLRRKARKVLRKIRKLWWSKNTVGVNVAYRTKMGRIVSPLQIVIEVDVAKKLSVDELKKRSLFVFPEIVDGVPVKVREIQFVSSIGRALPSAGSSPAASSRSASINGGIAVAPEGVDEWGTLGICLPNRLSSATEEVVAVSNRHVAGPKGGTVQNPPGVVTSPDDVFGFIRTAAFTELVDAALVVHRTGTSRNFKMGLPAISTPDKYRYCSSKVLGKKPFVTVQKLGANTGLQTGYITHRDREILVPDLGKKFKHVIEVSGVNGQVTDEGDSGSVLFGALDGKTVIIGLNFAMSEDRTCAYAIPFGRVLSSLQINVPANLLISLD